jgi:uncharacterized repeat protein (TIGR01451 family)
MIDTGKIFVRLPTLFTTDWIGVIRFLAFSVGNCSPSSKSSYFKRREKMKTRTLALTLLLGILFSVGASNAAAQVPFSVIDSDPNRYTSGVLGVWLWPSANHLVRDSSGKIYVIYTLATNQYTHYYNYVKWSSTGGATWSDAVWNDMMPDSSSTQSLVIDPLNILYEGFTFNVNPFFTKSADGGQTWTSPMGLDDWHGFAYHPSMVIDGAGTLHVAYFSAYGWWDYPFNLVYKKSTDGGATWSSPEYLTNLPHDFGTYGYGPEFPDLYAGKDGHLFILYAHISNSTSPSLTTKMLLHFDGTSWSDPIQVSADDTSSVQGDLAVDSNGIAHLAYHERDTGTGNYRILYRTYDPVAKTLSAPRTLTPATTNAVNSTMGIYSGDRVVIAYDLYNESTSRYGGVYSLTSVDNFTSISRISTHPEARTPNLRSSLFNMNQPDKMDIIWVEPNDVSGGEDLAYTELLGGIPEPGSLLVNVYGPKIVNPGQQSVYLVRYRNGMAVDSVNTVIKVSLPGNLPFVSCTGGGAYLRQTNEIVWNLGTVPVGYQGNLAFTLSVPWGEPDGRAGVIAKIDSATSPWHIMDVSQYLDPENIAASSDRFLTEGEIASLLATDPKLTTLHTLALSRGFGFYDVAKDVLLQDGRTLRLFVYVKGNPYELMFLRGLDGQYTLIRRDGNGTEYFDDKGGLIIRLDGSMIPYGEWSNPDYEGPYGPYAASPRGSFLPAPEDDDISYSTCLRNCLLSKANDVIVGDAIGAVYNVGKGAVNVYRGEWKEAGKDAIGAVSKAGGVIVDTVEGVGCTLTCYNKKNRKDYYCPEAANVAYTKWCASDKVVAEKRCSAGHMYYPLVFTTTCDEVGTRCVDGACVGEEKVCPLKKPTRAFQSFFPAPAPAGGEADMCDDDDSEIVPAHDPNAKSVDPAGNVVPGQTLTYTVEFENTGAGTAYGVFILDTLDTNLDESTLSIGGGGVYTPPDRLLSWDIGTLTPGQQGSVITTVKVKDGLPSGTEIVNIAEVHFPSASEITPTNPVVSIVKAIAADPKSVETTSGTPVSILLSGRDSGSSSITYRISGNPTYGTLTGTPPEMIYSAMEEFSGQDEFYYVAGNGLIESDPARVAIKVLPDLSDTNPPSVASTFPADGAQKVHFDAAPLSTNPYQYIPALTATFSEPIDAATLTAATFTVDGLTGNVSYDEPSKTAVFKPSSPLSPSTTYTARLSAGVKDKAGNPMEAYSWQFSTESPANIVVTLPDNGSQLYFGSLPIGQTTSTQIVTVVNTGTQDLIVGTISRSGTHPNDFVITDDLCSGATLMQSAQCTLKAAFAPAGAGARNGLLAIPSNDADASIYNVPATGTGIQQYTLTVSKEGNGSGTVTSSPAGIDCGSDCTELFDSGIPINLTASAAPSSDFTGWSGACSGAGPCSVALTANQSVTAAFTLKTYTLTVTSHSGGIVTPGTKAVNYGTDQTFNIIPNTGHYIVDVRIDGVSQGPISSYTFTNVTTHHTIEASFAIYTYTLGVFTYSGGVVTPGTKTVDYGSNQTFDVIPDPGYHILNVLVDGVSQGPISSYTFTNVTGHHTIEALFAINTYVLSVAVNGSGKGYVTSDPSRVDCGNGHIGCSPVFDHGTVVTLTPHPDPASVFAGWSGAGCAGKGACSVTMDSAKAVTAVFSRFLVEPVHGTYGTEIVLTGPGFGIKKGKVLLDTLSLKILSWQEGEIHCLLAKAMLPGTYPVTILPKEPKGTVISEDDVFTVHKPENLSLDQSSGTAGQTITLSGKFLGTKKGKIALEYDVSGVLKRKSCKVAAWPTTSIEGTGEGDVQFVVPKGIPSSSVCSVVVTNPMGETKLIGGFTIP